MFFLARTLLDASILFFSRILLALRNETAIINNRIVDYHDKKNYENRVRSVKYLLIANSVRGFAKKNQFVAIFFSSNKMD